MSTPLFSPAAVRAMDQRAFDRGVNPIALMDRAAGHLARAVLRAGGRRYGLRVGILCGRGNNGGDGLAAARLLADAGAAPRVHLVVDPDELEGDAAVQLRRWRGRGGTLSPTAEHALADAEVAVDCLLGTGAAGAPRGPYLPAVQALNACPATVVACDLPTGVDAATGEVPGAAVRADVTLTLGAHKAGLWLWPARGCAGDIELGELGIVDGTDEPEAELLGRGDIEPLLPPAGADAHKYTRGTVLVIAGSVGMSGAATLVARGAMAAGAGLVTVATTERAQPVVAATVPEAVTIPLPHGEDPDEAMAALGDRLEAADAVVVGPGLGTTGERVTLVRRLVAEVAAPLVLDADGLNAFRHAGDLLADHASGLLVLTPHEREFGRIATADAGRRDEVWAHRLETGRERAAAWDAVIVAKGPGTLVAAPDGRRWINPTGSPALATGGTGDVLAGMIGAAVAQQPAPGAVAGAVFVHGLAGEVAAAASHARSVTALDVAAAVPSAFRRIDQSQEP